MFESTGWKLEEPDSDGIDDLVLAYVKPNIAQPQPADDEDSLPSDD